MEYSLNIQELNFLIAVPQHNPTILTLDFLKYSGIIPPEWELARPPILSQVGSQVSFKNGVSIVAQTDRIAFSEIIVGKPPSDIAVAAIAQKYATALPQLKYQAVATTYQGYVPFERESQVKVGDYIFKELLSPNLQHNSQLSPKQASIELVYQLKDARTILKIDEATLIDRQKNMKSALAFSGRFTRQVANKEANGDRILLVTGAIDKWQEDLEGYKDLINRQFLPFIPKKSVLAMPI
jgi:hypothetical protein